MGRIDLRGRVMTWIVAGLVLVVAGTAMAQTPGAARFQPTGPRTAPADGRYVFDPKSGNPPPLIEGGGVGLEIGLDVDAPKWEVNSGADSCSYSESIAVAPVVSLFYALDETWDARVSLKFLDASDDDGDTSLVRFGVGTKARLTSESEFTPFFGLSLNYYGGMSAEETGVNARTVGDPDAALGFDVCGGVDYTVTDAMAMGVRVHYERLFADPDVDVDGGSGEYTFETLGFGFQLTVAF